MFNLKEYLLIWRIVFVIGLDSESLLRSLYITTQLPLLWFVSVWGLESSPVIADVALVNFEFVRKLACGAFCKSAHAFVNTLLAGSGSKTYLGVWSMNSSSFSRKKSWESNAWTTPILSGLLKSLILMDSWTNSRSIGCFRKASGLFCLYLFRRMLLFAFLLLEVLLICSSS